MSTASQATKKSDAGANGDGFSVAKLLLEGRAFFVVADRGVQALQPEESRGEVFLHPVRRLAAAGSRKPDGAAVGKPAQQRLARTGSEQNGRDAAQFKRFHHVGGTGQVVAVIAGEKMRSVCHRLHRHAPFAPGWPNFSIDWRNST
jgi:hypothetical protein